MSVSAGPADAPSRPDIADLVEALRDAGFPVGTSEAIDATQLLLVLGEREPQLGDRDRLRSHLRPVFCKSREQQERFDDIFEGWWARFERSAASPPLPPPPPPPPPPSSWVRRAAGTLVALTFVGLVVVGLAVGLVWQNAPLEPGTAPPVPGTEPPGPVAPAPVQPRVLPKLARDGGRATVDRLEPVFRFNVELRPSWIWLGALPLLVLLGVSMPALILSRTRLRRRSEPMFLDPQPLAIEARRLVPPIPPELSDRLARHVRSRGIDIERLARRPLVDVRRTIEATLRNHGIPVLRFSVARIHPCYLLLVDVASERDPRGRLFFQWAERLEREGLDVEILLLRRRRDEQSGAETLMVRPPGSGRPGDQGWTKLSQVRAPRFGERLIVVSDGNPLVDDGGTWRSDAVSSHLHRWRDRALFTPVEPRDWGAREEGIERPESAADPGFIVLPLEESALGAWTDLVVAGQLSTVALSEPQRYPGLLRQGDGRPFVAPEPPSETTLERLILELRVYLGEQGFHWLAAVAIAPIVRWELTLLLGKAALARLPRLADERSLSEALARNYRRLVRLPWLQRERMPDWLRLRLLAELSRARQQELRRVVEDLLQKISPRAVADGIELGFERPPGSDVDRRDALRGPRDAHTEGDPLYLGYMSGVSPEQLALRAPTRWTAWARRMRLPQEPGWRGWLARLRQRARAQWAQWAWADGLPYLGLNRWRTLTLLLLLLLLAGALVAAGRFRPAAPTPPGDPLFTDRAHPFVIEVPGAVSAAWSPDGRRVVTGGTSHTLRIWDAETGAPIGASLQGHTDRVLTVAWSPDARRIASGGVDGTVRLWDAETGAPTGQPLRRHESSVLSVAWSPDSQRVASASGDARLQIWDAQRGAAIGRPLVGHRDWIHAVAWSPDGRLIASGSNDWTLRIWDANSGDPIGGPLEGHRGWVWSVAWSPDGRRIVSGSSDGTLQLWSASGGDRIGSPLAGHTLAVVSVAWSPDGRRILSGSWDRTLRLWDADSYLPVGTPLGGNTDSLLTVAWRPDGQRALSLDDNGTLRFWGPESGTPVGKPLAGTSGRVTSMEWSPDGGHLVVVNAKGELGIWAAHTGVRVGAARRDSDQGSATMAAWSPDGKRIVRGDAEGTLSLWDASTGLSVLSFPGRHGGPIWSVAWSPDGRRIASGSNDSTLRIWDAETGAPIGSPLQNNTDVVASIAWSPDSRRIVCGNEDRTLRIWDAQTGTPIGRPLEGHAAAIGAVAWSPDGRRIASGGGDATVRLWDADTGAPIGPPLDASPAGMPASSERSTVFRIAWSRDGHRVIAATTSGAVLAWDVSSRAQVGVVRGTRVDAAAIGATGDYLAIATSPSRPPRPTSVAEAKLAEQATLVERLVEQAKRAEQAKHPERTRLTQQARVAQERLAAQLAEAKRAEQREQRGPIQQAPDPAETESTVRIWRLNPHPAPTPSSISRLQRLIASNVTAARAGSQPFWWLGGLTFAGAVLAVMRVKHRVKGVLARRALGA